MTEIKHIQRWNTKSNGEKELSRKMDELAEKYNAAPKIIGEYIENGIKVKVCSTPSNTLSDADCGIKKMRLFK